MKKMKAEIITEKLRQKTKRFVLSIFHGYGLSQIKSAYGRLYLLRAAAQASRKRSAVTSPAARLPLLT